MTSSSSKRAARSGSPKPSVNTADITHGDTANRSGTNRPLRTQTMWKVAGVISGAWIEKRISAPNKDAAMAEAHAIGMRVVECTELKQKQK